MALVRSENGTIFELPDIFSEGLSEDAFIPQEQPPLVPQEISLGEDLLLQEPPTSEPPPPDIIEGPAAPLAEVEEPPPTIDEFFAPQAQEAPVAEAQPSPFEQRTQGISDAFDQQRGVLGEAAEQAAGFGEELADLQTEKKDFLDQSAERIEAAEEQYRVEAARIVDQLKSEARAVASMNVDPKRAWADASTPRKIAGAVLMFLGGGLAVTTGTGKNPALEAFNQAIERDIDAQKANIRNAQKGFELNKSLYQMDLERLGSDVAAANQHRLRGIADIRSQLESIQARITNANQQANIKSAIAELDLQEQKVLEDQARYFENLQLRTRQQTETERSARAREALTKRDQNIKMAYLAFDREKWEANQKVKAAMQGVDPNNPKIIRNPGTGEPVGVFGGADNELAGYRERLNKSFDTARQVADLREQIKIIGSTYQGPGAVRLNSAEDVALRARYEAIRIDLLKAMSGAAVTPQEAERMEALIPKNPSLLQRSNVDTAYRIFQDKLANTANRESRAFNIHYDWSNDFLAQGSGEREGGTPSNFFLAERIGALESVLGAGAESPEEVKREALGLANWLIENPGHPDADIAFDALGQAPQEAVEVFQRGEDGSLETVDLRMRARFVQTQHEAERASRVRRKEEQKDKTLQFLGEESVSSAVKGALP